MFDIVIYDATSVKYRNTKTIFPCDLVNTTCFIGKRNEITNKWDSTHEKNMKRHKQVRDTG